MDKITLLDTTLRDGAQSVLVSLSPEDKRAIALILDGLGLDYIEAGFPTAEKGDADAAFFRDPPSLRHSKLAAFGATRRKDAEASSDAGLRALVDSNAPVTVIFGKSWHLHVTDVLGCGLDENLRMIEDSVRFLKNHSREVIFDAEHFFDGWRHDASYALAALEAARSGGADILCLCDTRGGTLPDDAYEIVREVRKHTDAVLGVHAHNDAGMAGAVSVMAVLAGCRHVQGTLCGFGERCGNADLVSAAIALQVKRGYRCLPPESLPGLTRAARRVSELCNLAVPQNQPYVGSAAFAHKAGMHIAGVMKNPETFEHISPETVGNTRRLMITDHSGRAQVLPILRRVKPEAEKDGEEMERVLRALRERQGQGYGYEAAEASFELMIRDLLGLYEPAFTPVHYTVSSGSEAPDSSVAARAMVKVSVRGKDSLAAGEGDGPVNALDAALRVALAPFYPRLRDMRLTDYKVRVLNPTAASAATVRVLIASTDGTRDWSTIGISTDIIRASWQALYDSARYFLLMTAETVTSGGIL
jgi:2-isopropylmalate synthase